MARVDYEARERELPSRHGSRLAAAMVVGVIAVAVSPVASAQEAKSDGAAPAEQKVSDAPAAGPAVPGNFDIDEFRVDGADTLPQITIEEAVYPFLGPGRTAEDVEKARASLEKSYHDRGYQTVNVSIPQQNVANRVVVLKVTEGKVGRLRVANSRYFDTDKIKKKVPSLKEGVVPNFDEVTKDLVALNQWPGRRVTPALRAGVTPGTVDVDLTVEDKLPFHGSVELSNRQSANTTATRLNTTLKYDNLWQLGHSISLSYQVAPQRPDDAQVISGSYLARLTDWTSLLVYGVKSRSDLATVGGMNIVGPGQVFGARAVMTLPAQDNYFHSLSFGMDYKHFGQTVQLGKDSFDSPITYYPLTASYGGTWQQEKALTQFNLGLTFNLRGPGSGFEEFDAKRGYANSSFIHLNADIAQTRELKHGFELFGSAKAQIADGPLVSSEQFSLGGLDTVRGYYESEAIGDNGLVGTLELRSPNIGDWLQTKINAAHKGTPPDVAIFKDWRFFGFIDGGVATIHKPLPDQESTFGLWSYGIGTRFKLFNEHMSGMVAVAVPLADQSYTKKNDPRVHFSLSGEF